MAPRQARDVRAEAERSFEQLYRGHRGDVYRAALRELGNTHDAEDVTQAAFVDAYRAVLRGTRPEAPRAWLLTIAENVRRRRFRTSLKRPREEPLDADTALAADDSNEQAGALVDALATLTTEQREVFLLREIRGFSYDEIAQRTDATVASVQMLLFRARKTLRDELEPPQVQGVFFPWVASLLSRVEAFSLAPRAAGAIGAAALAVGVSASVPASADPPPLQSAAPERAALVSTALLAGAVPARPAPAAKPAAKTRAVKKAAPVHAAAQDARRSVPVATTPQSQPDQSQPTAQSQPQSEQQPALQSQPLPLPEPQPLPLPKIVTPPAIPLVPPAVPTPSLPPPPLLDPVIEPVLEGAGAAGAAGASAPPLPVLPLDPLPPELP